MRTEGFRVLREGDGPPLCRSGIGAERPREIADARGIPWQSFGEERPGSAGIPAGKESRDIVPDIVPASAT